MLKRLKHILIVAIFLTITVGCLQSYSDDQERVCFGKKCFLVDVAQTDEERMRGLQLVNDLCENCGMLFIFDEDKPYGFWMKDTLIPLDMIWLDSQQRIVHIKNNASPCKNDPCEAYYPGALARYVVELNAGKASALGLSLGDKAEFHSIKE